MEAALFDLILDIATATFLKIPEHFRQHQFEGVRAHRLIIPSGIRIRFLETFPGHVKRGSITVRGILDGIHIAFLGKSLNHLSAQTNLSSPVLSQCELFGVSFCFSFI